MFRAANSSRSAVRIALICCHSVPCGGRSTFVTWDARATARPSMKRAICENSIEMRSG
jgi:hypothetical protein